MSDQQKISGWGHFPAPYRAEVVTPESVTDLADQATCIARGNGRSYGDASMATKVVSTLKQTQILALNTATGILDCSSGHLLRDVINYVVPQGFLVPVIPGTQFVTMGGMVASDIHGKNHGVAGTIGNWVQGLEVQLENGNRVWCSAQEHADLFKATVGGMGLTGIITRIHLKLEVLPGPVFEQETQEAQSIEGLMDLLTESTAPFKVAWLDLLNRNRFLLLAGRYGPQDEAALARFKLPSKQLTIPTGTPGIFLNAKTMGIYNLKYYAGQLKALKKPVALDQFLLPLDKMGNWNRLYGKQGLLQYQFILPLAVAKTAAPQIIDAIKSAPYAAMLVVLKEYKVHPHTGYLTFPIEGFSFAIDFKLQPGLTAFLNKIDKIVADFGGRVYLTKDACLQKETFELMYPEIEAFKTTLKKYNPNQRFKSDQAVRLGLVD